MSQNSDDVESLAQKYIDTEKGVETTKDALKGACDIMAEWVSENIKGRNLIRKIYHKEGVISSSLVKGKEEEAKTYQQYFDWKESIADAPSHRILAMFRAEAEGLLKVKLKINDEEALKTLDNIFVKADNSSTDLVQDAIDDAWKRLLEPSLETEIRAIYKEKADEVAIKVFAENLRQLLLAAPIGQKRVLALDPGFRTGCKVVILNEYGALLHNETIYPHPPQNEIRQATNKIRSLVNAYKIEVIAIGNGTASRECEQMVRVALDTIASTPNTLHATPQVFVVSESGASVYSASKIARDEFPNEDVTVRGAVSIGRRLMDPLAELVKIDPKSIGVGQYQHDVNQTRLGESLQQTVESVVNHVGVDVNTASKHILTYVSGLGPALAQNIVNYRSENGAFPNRKALLKVPKMGTKTFEQAAGFLRVTNSDNPLDNSAVHPESYSIVEKMAKDLKCTVSDLMSNATLRGKIELQRYVTDQVGMPTLQDIMRELEKPSRDPREQLEEWHFDEKVHTIDDLQIGMVLPGIVTNIANFGAFVDIGVHKDGLVHISEMSNRRISTPAEVVALHQHVMVKVIDIDKQRGRIQLSMKH